MTTPKTTLAASAEYDEQRTRGSSVCSDLSLSSSTSSLHSYRRIPNQSTAVWNHGDVRQWLASHQLGHVAERYGTGKQSSRSSYCFSRRQCSSIYFCALFGSIINVVIVSRNNIPVFPRFLDLRDLLGKCCCSTNP